MYYSHILRMPDNPNGGGAGGTGAPAAAAPAGGGAPEPDFVDSMVAEMNAAASKEPAPSGQPAPAAPAGGAPATPAAKAPEAPKPGAPAAPAPKGAQPPKPTAQPPKPTAPPAAKPGGPAEQPLDWKTAPEQFRAAHQKLVEVHQQETNRLTTELTNTQSKMRELEGRKFLSPEQERKYADLEKDQQRLAAELYARDYAESPEFKKTFEDKAALVYQDMDRELSGMMVNAEDGNQRQATRADFQKVVMEAFKSKTAATKMAKELFGEDNAAVVLDGAKQLAQIQREGQAAIDAKRAGYKTEREQQQQQLEQTRTAANQSFTQYDAMLEKTFPQYFAPIEGNDQYNRAREEGLNYVDSVVRGIKNDGSPQDIQSSAIVRRWAAAFPASQVIIKQQGEKIAELQALIDKLKGSDPGNLGEGGAGGGAGGEEAGGTDALAQQIDEITRQG